VNLHLHLAVRFRFELLGQGSTTSSWKKLVGPRKWLNLSVIGCASAGSNANASKTARDKIRARIAAAARAPPAAGNGSLLEG
jgi:hypothetical protein